MSEEATSEQGMSEEGTSELGGGNERLGPTASWRLCCPPPFVQVPPLGCETHISPRVASRCRSHELGAQRARRSVQAQQHEAVMSVPEPLPPLPQHAPLLQFVALPLPRLLLPQLLLPRLLLPRARIATVGPALRTVCTRTKSPTFGAATPVAALAPPPLPARARQCLTRKGGEDESECERRGRES